MKYRAIAIFLACASAAHGQPLHLLTEEYPPFSFHHEGELVGTSVDQVRQIMDAAKIDYAMEMQPWARAFALAANTANTCVFTTALLPERMAHFKWVEPLLLDQMILVRKAGRSIKPATIDEARNLTIGAHNGDYAESYARQRGFSRLDSAPTLNLSLKKLLGGRVDLMIMTHNTYESLRQKGNPIEAVLTLEDMRGGIACNLAVPDQTIRAMQVELDKLIANGTQAAIYTRYDRPGK